ncbi:MAG: MBL fold metallo-hydrolase [Sedimentisphaerales bacterium]|nr:MBL fold metallo-hydrolase [Sedimentisphaerales bacterium]
MGWGMENDGKMSLRLFIGGMRGSRPATGGAFEIFGGDTTSLLVVGSGGERLVLDAGTGMCAVARELVRTEHGEATVLFSHYHLDHLAGLMMNPLFYAPEWTFHFVGPTFADGGVRQAITRLLAPPYWPVPWERMRARLEFSEFAEEGIRTGNLCVRGCSMPHPGGCMAYRIEDGDSGASLVFATDFEWPNRSKEQEATFMTMCREPKAADAIVMDAHFIRADAHRFAGWGHNCWEDCLDIAESAGIPCVILGHHAPDADDEALFAREQQVKKRMPRAALARAGQWLTISGQGT